MLALLLLCVPVFAFQDDADIGAKYREAIAEMVRREVLDGFTDGFFRADEYLTREQGAKIIACLSLGKPEAETLCYTDTVFEDVTPNRWSASYIAWCAEQGIVHGYGDGLFGPTDTLTGDQFAKMLLCVLEPTGGRNYTGSGDWYKAVREDAKAAGLYDGDPFMETAQPIRRGQAALLSWNAVRERTSSGQQSALPDSPVSSETPLSASMDESDSTLPPAPSQSEETTDPTKAASATAFFVSEAAASAGQKNVAVTISVRGNPGISSIGMLVSFSNQLSLRSVVYNTEIGGEHMQPQTLTSPVKLIWLSPFHNVTGDWTFATLYFDVSDMAPAGKQGVTISYDPDDVYNMAEQNIAFEIVNGFITIE